MLIQFTDCLSIAGQSHRHEQFLLFRERCSHHGVRRSVGRHQLQPGGAHRSQLPRNRRNLQSKKVSLNYALFLGIFTPIKTVSELFCYAPVAEGNQ